MSILHICTYPEKILREPAEPIKKIDEEVARLAPRRVLDEDRIQGCDRRQVAATLNAMSRVPGLVFASARNRAGRTLFSRSSASHQRVTHLDGVYELPRGLVAPPAELVEALGLAGVWRLLQGGAPGKERPEGARRLEGKASDGARR